MGTHQTGHVGYTGCCSMYATATDLSCSDRADALSDNTDSIRITALCRHEARARCRR